MVIYAAVPVSLLETYADGPQTVFQVCGVFSTSVYLRSASGSMLLLHDSRYGLLPFGVGISQIPYFLQAAHLSMYMEAVLEGEMLDFPGTGVQLWLLGQRNLPPSGQVPNRDELAVAVVRGQRRLATCHKGVVARLVLPSFAAAEQGDDLFAKLAAEPLCALRRGLLSRDSCALSDALSGLLGLGPGLTPSMDDFVTGMIYTLLYAVRWWQMSLPEAPLLAEQIHRLAPEKTGIFSVAYLRAAAAGQPFSLLEDVLRVEDGLLNDAAVDALLRVGSSSGGDMLTGVVYGLMYLLEGGSAAL